MKSTPFWWDASKPARLDRPDLPGRADAVVIGSGYTGLHAALALARAGRSVVVLEAGQPGQGCSTRNGGQISTSIKPGFDTLAKRHGKETARAILDEGIASRAFVEDFVTGEGIDCAFANCGRFHAAAHPRAFAQLEKLKGERVSIVSRAKQRSELGSDFYHGGAVFHDHASLDPGKYHAGLLTRVLQAGVQVAPDTPASAIVEDKTGVTVTTPHGQIHARDVALATNGYSGPLSPWHRRRVIPIGSYIIATEDLGADTMADLFPTRRIASDSRRVVYYYRPCPEYRRILFGGRVTAAETDTITAAARLRAAMVQLFAQTATAAITHSWSGRVAYSFDSMPHTGARGRVHHAMGYCGSGVGMASYLGRKIGLRIAGDPAGDTALMGRDFPTRPFYAGRPWFLPAAVETYRLMDRLGL